MTASVVTEAYIKYIMLSTGYMARPKLSENARRMLNKGRESRSSTKGLQKPGYMALFKSREAPNNMPRRPMPEGNTNKVNPPDGTKDSTRAGSSGEVLTNCRGTPCMVEDIKVGQRNCHRTHF
jgi:hypothetical protein